MKKGDVNPVALVILLFMLVSILFYVLSVVPGERERLLQTIPKYSNTLLSASPGLVQETDESDLDLIEHSLGTLLVDATPETESSLLSPTVTVSNSVARTNEAEFNVTIPDLEKISGAFLQFIVAESKDVLGIKVNGAAVYSQELPVSASQVTIEIPTSVLVQGENIIELSAKNPSLNIISPNKYTLNNVLLLTNEYQEGLATTQFSLTGSEIRRTKTSTLNAFVRRLSNDYSNVAVKFNEIELFNSQIISSTSLSLNIPLSYLQEGVNIIELTSGPGTLYRFSFLRLTNEVYELSSKAKTYEFDISQADYERIRLKTTPKIEPAFKCILKAIKSSGGNTLTITINGATTTTVIEGSELKRDVCEDLLRGTNSLTLSADEDIVIDSLTLTLTNKQEEF
jgi:hypothetical protein